MIQKIKERVNKPILLPLKHYYDTVIKRLTWLTLNCNLQLGLPLKMKQAAEETMLL